ncbi:hypothetical protein [Nonomuraea dietziae]|uniref:hypothetical protein n=1 Tax=Nonomuraea dietziae TaxID=65515 RepID=UPI0031E3E2E5
MTPPYVKAIFGIWRSPIHGPCAHWPIPCGWTSSTCSAASGRPRRRSAPGTSARPRPSCSFHLRQLAKYGYVVQAESEDQRERPWRVADLRQSWSASEGGIAAAELERVFVEREAVRLLDWSQARPEAPEEWRSAAFLSGVTAPLTARELDEVGERLLEVLAPYIARTTGQASVPEDARFVRILLTGTPLPEDS